MLTLKLNNGLVLNSGQPESSGGWLSEGKDGVLSVFFDSIELQSHLHNSKTLGPLRCFGMSLMRSDVLVAHMTITEQDFISVFHTFNAEVKDELNALGIGEEKTPSKDQLQGAGTNNFTRV